VFKTMSYEDFALKSAALERWCTLLPPENKSLEILREAVDIKKVNSSFIKSGPNDNLIVDAYCQLYMEITPTLDLDVKVEDGFFDVDKNGKDGPDQATKRIKGVGRRELLRRAEAAGINPAMVSAPVLALRQAMAAAAARERQDESSSGAEPRIMTPPLASRDEDAASTRNTGTPRPRMFVDADDDDEDESELSELDDIQSLDADVMRLVKRSSRGSSPAGRSEGFTAPAEEGASEGVRPRLGSAEVEAPGDDVMEDVPPDTGPKSPGGETAPS
jgi:hypothetical protein